MYSMGLPHQLSENIVFPDGHNGHDITAAVTSDRRARE